MFDICPFVIIQQNNRDAALRRGAVTFWLDPKSNQKGQARGNANQ